MRESDTSTSALIIRSRAIADLGGCLCIQSGVPLYHAILDGCDRRLLKFSFANILVLICTTHQIIIFSASNWKVLEMAPSPMEIKTNDNRLWNSVLASGNQSSSNSLTRTISNDRINLFVDQSKHFTVRYSAPAAAAPAAPAAPVRRIFRREVVVFIGAVLLYFAGTSFFTVPACGIFLHTTISFWRRGMLGWTAFVSYNVTPSV